MLLTLAALAPAAEASFPGKNGKLAVIEHLVREGDDGLRLNSVEPSGAALTLLDSGEASGRGFWSPNGAQIAFQSGLATGCCYYTPDINLANADGSNQTLVLDGGPQMELFGWSPGGERLLLTSRPNRRVRRDIYTVRLDGSGLVRLTDTQYASEPAWSPDGARIAYVDGNAGNADVFVVPANGGPSAQLTSDPAADRFPTWSPEGRQIAFVRYLDPLKYELRTVNADGSSETHVAGFDGYIDSLSWSHDGAALLFRHEGDIYKVRPDGTGLTRLTDTGRASDPVWSPDDQKIAFADGSDLEVMNRDGSGKTAVLSGSETSGWSPSDWQAIPTRSAFKSSEAFCKAERAYWGNGFAARYGGGQSAYGKCVSAK